MNKRSAIGFGFILLVLVIILAVGWLMNENSKECRKDSECMSDQYCGSDFSCHALVVTSYTPDFTPAAWILGISIIIAAVILRSDKIFKKKSTKYNAEETGLYEGQLE